MGWVKTPKGGIMHVRGSKKLTERDRILLGQVMDTLAAQYATEQEEGEMSDGALRPLRDQPAAPTQPTKTVWCNTNKALTRSFVEPAEAIAYANQLLRSGHRARLADWKPPKQQSDKHFDRLTQQYPDGPPWLRA